MRAANLVKPTRQMPEPSSCTQKWDAVYIRSPASRVENRDRR
jgi:hypothetical protein